MAAMSVIGIDFGNESCYIAAARAGGIETVANDYSLRATPSCVAFTPKSRIMGVAGKNQLVTNMKNTVYGFKRLLGRKFSDPHAQEEIKHLSYPINGNMDDSIGICVNYRDQKQTFSPEQITAMFFGKLKEIAESALQTKVNDCVISVPSFFTNAERQALLDAAQIAGLNVLRLMNETLATALSYGMYKQDLPEPDAKPRNVVFVDWGHSSLQVSACAFHKGKLKMIATAGDAHLGGRDIDEILATYFNDHFRSTYRVDAKTNNRAWVRLLAEVEKIKKQMSANSTKLPLNIECFMDDKDVKGEIQRAIMEELCAGLFERAEQVMRRCLEDSRLRLDDIHAVEIVGGSSRVPAIKNLIVKVFNHQPSTTLNQDEAVARGCALQCACLSPAVRVREFSLTDIQPYPIKLSWEPVMGEDDADMLVFPKNHPVPFTRMLTFYRSAPFYLNARYQDKVPFPDPFIGHYTINDVKPGANGDSQKVKIKVKIGIHGTFKVSQASLVEVATAENSAEPMEADGAQDGEEKSPTKGENEAKTEDVDMEEQSDNKKGSKKVKYVYTDLPVESQSHGLSPDSVNCCFELECQMVADDRQEKERADARNALEEYVYELRGQLGNEDELYSFVEDGERSSLNQALDDMENWLYEEGEDCMRKEYVDRLAQLKARGEPIKGRSNEFRGRTSALEDLSHSIIMARKSLDEINSGAERFNHLGDDDVKKLSDAISKTYQWLEEKRGLLARTSRTQDPPILVSALRLELQGFTSTVNSVVNKQKPKVEPPPTNNSEPAAQNKEGEQPSEQTNGETKEDNMDVD